MKKVAAIIFSVLVSLAFVVPAAHAEIMVVSDAKYPSPEYVEFVRVFTKGLNGQFKKSVEQPASDHWIIFLSPTFSPAMVAQVTIIAIRAEGESERPILIAVLNEDSDERVVRTAVKSTQRVLMGTSRQQQREEPSHQMGEVRKWQ